MNAWDMKVCLLYAGANWIEMYKKSGKFNEYVENIYPHGQKILADFGIYNKNNVCV